MIILVKTPSGKTIEIFADPKDTIEKIKEKIQDKEGFVPDQIILVFNSRILMDNYKLEDYNIMWGATLEIKIRIRGCSMPTIYLNFNGRKTEMKICICGGLKHIKEQIQEKLGIKPESQELSLNGKIFDDRMFFFVNIVKRSLPFSVIDLEIK